MPSLEGKAASSADIILDLMSIPTKEKWEFFKNNLTKPFIGFRDLIKELHVYAQYSIKMR